MSLCSWKGQAETQAGGCQEGARALYASRRGVRVCLISQMTMGCLPRSSVAHLLRWDNALVRVVPHEAVPRAERQRCGQRKGRSIGPVAPAGGVRPGSENRLLRV